jgi:hypothetical protein
MEKLKLYGSLFLGLLSVFLLGVYVEGTIHCNIIIQPHRWMLTGLFGMLFLSVFLIDYRKNK